MTFSGPRERPTATTTHVDVSVRSDRASAAAVGRLTENDLILAHLYSHPLVPRTEPCACGGVIFSPDDEAAMNARAVLAHNLSPQHERWREDWV